VKLKQQYPPLCRFGSANLRRYLSITCRHHPVKLPHGGTIILKKNAGCKQLPAR